MENKENFEKSEITLFDLVQIAGRWIWVLLFGAVLCAVLAFFYSTNMVTPMYSSSSKYVVQTKGQAAESDILESQRTVAFGQLVVGTYIDIINTDNFAQEIANHLNGNLTEQTYSSDAIDLLLKYGIIADGGIVEGKELRKVINELANAGILDDSVVNTPIKEVVKSRFVLSESATEGKTTEEIDALLEEALKYENLFPKIISDADLLSGSVYIGGSDENLNILRNEFGIEEGKSFGGKTYKAKQIRSMISFSTAEESTTFNVTVKSSDSHEAYAIARVCEMIIGDYIERIYPGTGVVTVIDSADENKNPINNNTAFLVIIGFVAGFIIAYIIVYIIEMLDDRIKNQEELAAKTGLSVVGIIPDSQYEKSGKGYYTYSAYDPARKSKKK